MNLLDIAAKAWWYHPRLDAAYDEAMEISAKGYHYVFGGGHPGFGPNAGGYDCSGFASAVLHDAHLYPPINYAMDTNGFNAYWGVPGRGRWLTVWIHNFSFEHMFLDFHNYYKWTHQYFAAETRGVGHFQYEDFNGFIPRHWPYT